jgi:hypothetical protein
MTTNTGFVLKTSFTSFGSHRIVSSGVSPDDWCEGGYRSIHDMVETWRRSASYRHHTLRRHAVPQVGLQRWDVVILTSLTPGPDC